MQNVKFLRGAPIWTPDGRTPGFHWELTWQSRAKAAILLGRAATPGRTSRERVSRPVQHCVAPDRGELKGVLGSDDAKRGTGAEAVGHHS